MITFSTKSKLPAQGRYTPIGWSSTSFVSLDTRILYCCSTDTSPVGTEPIHTFRRRADSDYLSHTSYCLYGNRPVTNYQITGKITKQYVSTPDAGYPVATSQDIIHANGRTNITRPLEIGQAYAFDDISGLSYQTEALGYLQSNTSDDSRSWQFVSDSKVGNGIIDGGDVEHFACIGYREGRAESTYYTQCVRWKTRTVGEFNGVKLVQYVRLDWTYTYRSKKPVEPKYVTAYCASQAVARQGSKFVVYQWNELAKVWDTKPHASSFRVPGSRLKDPLDSFLPDDVTVLGLEGDSIRPNDAYGISATAASTPASNWSREEIKETLASLSNRYAQFQAQIAGRFDRRELHDQLFDQVPYFSGNLLAYLRDLKSIGNTAKIAASAFLAKDSLLRQAPSAWLGLRYGDRLTIADTTELLTGHYKMALRKSQMEQKGHLSVRARHISSFPISIRGHEYEVHVVAAARLGYTDASLSSLEGVFAKLYNWDAILLFQNSWDLVPYSFVVDWFVDIESIMQAIDRRIASNYYDVKYVVDSQKYTLKMRPEDLNPRYTGELTFSSYRRNVGQTLLFSPLRVEAGHMSTKNVVDGIMLIVGK